MTTPANLCIGTHGCGTTHGEGCPLGPRPEARAFVSFHLCAERPPSATDSGGSIFYLRARTRAEATRKAEKLGGESCCSITTVLDLEELETLTTEVRIWDAKARRKKRKARGSR